MARLKLLVELEMDIPDVINDKLKQGDETAFQVVDGLLAGSLVQVPDLNIRVGSFDVCAEL